MKVLVDSNVILEVILQREQVDQARKCLSTLIQGNHEAYLTVGGFYGMIYTVDNYLRKVMGLKKPDRIDALRSIMKQVLNKFQVAEHDRESLLRSINDKVFSDLEDSCQYQAALKEGCTWLLTFNKSDFDVSGDAAVKVMTPQEFLNSK
jgi:predicted nucleic acid-binding protein